MLLMLLSSLQEALFMLTPAHAVLVVDVLASLRAFDRDWLGFAS
jgi:hypothetical protein